MNTSKQVNVMIGAVFFSFLLFTGYMVNEANRQQTAREEITERVAHRGARLYVNNCRSCHGLEGEGFVAPALNQKAFLVLGKDNQYGAEATAQGEADAVRGFLSNTISCGRTNTIMPIWGQRFGGSLSDTQVNQIVTMLTEGRWDLVREVAAEHDPTLYGDIFVAQLPSQAELAQLPRAERRALLKEHEEAVAAAQEQLRAQIERGEYPAEMKAEILVKDASTFPLTEKNCGQFTADTAQDIKGRDPTVAKAAVAATPAPAAAGGAPPAGGAAAQGRTLATQQGCAACHSTGGAAGVGPTWKGIAGSTAQFADGSSGTRDEAYLREAIVSPDAKIVKGFTPGIMPKTFGEKLSADQINALIEYMKTLK